MFLYFSILEDLLFLQIFGRGHIQSYSGVIPGSVLWSHAWWCSKGLYVMRGIEPTSAMCRQVPYFFRLQDTETSSYNISCMHPTSRWPRPFFPR